MDNYGPRLTEEVRLRAVGHNLGSQVTPTQASWRHRIECQFTALKEFALNNSDYRSHGEQIEAIRRYLGWRNRKRGISLAEWKGYHRQQAIPARWGAKLTDWTRH